MAVFIFPGKDASEEFNMIQPPEAILKYCSFVATKVESAIAEVKLSTRPVDALGAKVDAASSRLKAASTKVDSVGAKLDTASSPPRCCEGEGD